MSFIVYSTGGFYFICQSLKVEASAFINHSYVYFPFGYFDISWKGKQILSLH